MSIPEVGNNTPDCVIVVLLAVVLIFVVKGSSTQLSRVLKTHVEVPRVCVALSTSVLCYLHVVGFTLFVVKHLFLFGS